MPEHRKFQKAMVYLFRQNCTVSAEVLLGEFFLSMHKIQFEARTVVRITRSLNIPVSAHILHNSIFVENATQF